LCAGSQPQPALAIDREVDVNGQVLVRSQVVDNSPPLMAVNHVRIEAACFSSGEGSYPRHRLAPKPIDERVVFDREGNGAFQISSITPCPMAATPSALEKPKRR